MPSASDKATHTLIHQALLDRRGKPVPPWLWHFLETLKTSNGATLLSSAYEETGRSARYVGERFKRSTGVSPKVLGRIYRLNALLGAVDPGRPIPWTDLAHRFGFFDQAHFNREFRRFSGLSPTQYSADRLKEFPTLKKGENVNFVPRNQ